MLGLGLSLNKGGGQITGGEPVEEREDLLDSYVFDDDTLGWGASGTSGSFDAHPGYASYTDSSTTNVGHRILKIATASNIYSAFSSNNNPPSTIYYKLDVMNSDPTSVNITGIASVSAFGKQVNVFSEHGNLTYNQRTQIYGSIENVEYSNYYYYIDIHKDPSDYNQESHTDGDLTIYSIEFASYDLSV